MQKALNSSTHSFFSPSLSWPSAIVMTLLYLGGGEAQSAEIPGLAIGRLALPSVQMNEEYLNPTGTAVGEKVGDFLNTLVEIENETDSNIQSFRELYDRLIKEIDQYYLVLGKIEAKLQIGTTPSNPRLIKLQNRASLQLDQIASMISQENSLAENLSMSFQRVKALSNQIQTTFVLPGAVDEDHAHLFLLSDEIAKLESSISRSLDIVNGNNMRQNNWLNLERASFSNLSFAIEKGVILELSQARALPYPTSIPSLELRSSKEPHSHLHKHHPEKHSQREVPIKTASLAPLPLIPLQERQIEEVASLSPSENQVAIIPSPPEALPPIPEEIGTEEVVSPSLSENQVAILPPPPEALPPIPEEIRIEEVAPLSPSENQVAVLPPSHKASSVPNQRSVRRGSTGMSASRAPSTPSPKHEEEALPKVTVAPHPEAQPLAEQENVQPSSPTKPTTSETPSALASLPKDRPPLGLLEPDQDPISQKWYLFSSAKRGLKKPSDVVEIISISKPNASTHRGEEVKNLLIEMGLKPEQIQLINITSTDDQEGKVYLFAGK